ncbi:hypothetical protein Sjap_016032 [Stephania japonica]|uniref:Agglutinin domain-containing protein n=1 Tax=Stephania japonica TaxID=461633 RepID=A0AAP0NTD7_9MAGN
MAKLVFDILSRQMDRDLSVVTCYTTQASGVDTERLALNSNVLRRIFLQFGRLALNSNVLRRIFLQFDRRREQDRGKIKDGSRSCGKACSVTTQLQANEDNRSTLEYLSCFGLLYSSVDEGWTDLETRFVLEKSKNSNILVHIRSIYNNKYWVRKQSKTSTELLSTDHDEDLYLIAATADKIEEDTAKWSCTLFEHIDRCRRPWRWKP